MSVSVANRKNLLTLNFTEGDHDVFPDDPAPVAFRRHPYRPDNSARDAENLRAQSLMTGALSILIFAGLLTVVAIDYPFAGTVKVGPEALAAVVNDFARAPPQR
jgi:hypothetical protein